MGTKMAFTMYKPHKDKESELLDLVREHLPTLREYGLVTKRDGYLARSTAGILIEVFEWASEEAKDAAHEHPAIAKIWERMAGISDFASMQDLPEGALRFPNFDFLEI